MDKTKIKEDLKGMTDGFCHTFHGCADEILEHPEKIPEEYRNGRESEYIAKVCMKKVIKLTET